MAGKRARRLTPEMKTRLQKLASRATQRQLSDRMGLSERQVRRILEECPDCESCGEAAPLGTSLCQRCAENAIGDIVARKGHLCV